MKIINFIGLRETACIMYVGNRKNHYDNEVTYEEVMYMMYRRLYYDRQYFWIDLDKDIEYCLYR